MRLAASPGERGPTRISRMLSELFFDAQQLVRRFKGPAATAEFCIALRERELPPGLDVPGLRLVEPLGYLDFLALIADAKLVMTDSGGIQEETTALGVPCLTLRENTERPVTVEVGTNQLVGTDPARAVAAAREVLAGGARRGRIPELWDGRAAERVAGVLVGFCERRR